MAVDKLVDSAQLDSDLTSVANAIRTKGGTSASLSFPADFVSAIAAIPSGGGNAGAVKIANGTVIGNNNSSISIPVGKKMPKTDFVFKVWANGAAEFPYDTYYKFACCALVVLKGYSTFNLSSDGTESPQGFVSLDVNDSGTVTTITMNPAFFVHQTIRNASIGATASGNPSSQKIIRSSEGFSITLNQGNSVYKFPSTITYNWEVWYFGNSAATDIVEVP